MLPAMLWPSPSLNGPVLMMRITESDNFSFVVIAYMLLSQQEEAGVTE